MALRTETSTSQTGLDQHTCIDRHVNLTLRFGFVREDPRHELGHAVKPVRQKSKGALAGLCHDPQHADVLGKDLKRQQHFQFHQ